MGIAIIVLLSTIQISLVVLAIVMFKKNKGL